MDAFTVLVLAAGAGAAAAVTRARRYRDPWNLMSLATAQYRLQVRADDGVLGGGTRAEVDRLADEHFDGTLEGVTLGDLFPALCSPHWEAATAVMLGCLIRNHRIPRGFRPPSFDQYELLRAYWVPRPSRRRTYDTPRTARDYIHLANTYAALPVEAEDGAIERVPADWFRGYLTSQECHADKAPISVLLRALEPDQTPPPGGRTPPTPAAASPADSSAKPFSTRNSTTRRPTCSPTSSPPRCGPRRTTRQARSAGSVNLLHLSRASFADTGPGSMVEAPARDGDGQLERCPLIGYLRLDGRVRSGQAGVEVSGGVALTSAAHRGLVWLNSGVRLAGHRDEEWLQRGLTGSR